tara:strand:+ start:1789 stop:2394 length:606 start_codon:yes stop_codon:yes gene_type:complete
MRVKRAAAARERAKSGATFERAFKRKIKKTFAEFDHKGDFMGTKGGILALDLGKKTGVAVLNDQGHLCWHTELKLGKLDIEARTYQLYDHLARLVRMFEPSAIFSEKVLLSGMGRKESLAYMEAMVVLVSRKNKLPWHSVWPSSLKKATTGNGRCSKEDMLEASKRRWNIEQHIKLSDNVADALAVADWAISSGTFVVKED